jgi:hypothetical protein
MVVLDINYGILRNQDVTIKMLQELLQVYLYLPRRTDLGHSNSDAYFLKHILLRSEHRGNINLAVTVYFRHIVGTLTAEFASSYAKTREIFHKKAFHAIFLLSLVEDLPVHTLDFRIVPCTIHVRFLGKTKEPMRFSQIFSSPKQKVLQDATRGALMRSFFCPYSIAP